MKLRKLGRSNIKVSAMGMGCWAIGGPFYHKDGILGGYGHVKDEESIKTIQRALDLGITIFDTADVYGCGRSERVLGEALKDRRDEIIISTKFGKVWNLKSGNTLIPCQYTGDESTRKHILDAIEGSLQRLQTDYIDLYQLHTGDLPPEKAPAIIEILEEFIEEGKIRTYGWSTDDPDRAKVFAKEDHCSTVQFRHNWANRNPQMLMLLDEHNLGGLIKGPLGYGLHTGKYHIDTQLPMDHRSQRINFQKERYPKIINILERVREILTDDGRTLPQASISWLWATHEKVVPIPGCKNIAQIEENAQSLELGPLSNGIVKQINGLFTEIALLGY